MATKVKQIYDIMLCDDGVARAVPVVNGVKQDPSLKEKQDDSEKKRGRKKISTKNQYSGSYAR